MSPAPAQPSILASGAVRLRPLSDSRLLRAMEERLRQVEMTRSVAPVQVDVRHEVTSPPAMQEVALQVEALPMVVGTPEIVSRDCSRVCATGFKGLSVKAYIKLKA